MDKSIGQLVIRAAAGDDQAFDELVSIYRSRIYYLVLSKVHNREAALDLAQETFIRAYMSLNTLREPEKFSSWLAAIAQNVCRMYLRGLCETPLPSEAIDEIMLRANNTADLSLDAMLALDILDKLPNGTRDAAVLYFIEEMKMSEVAEFLEIPLTAVKARIRDARSHFRKEMIDMVRTTVRQEEPGDDFNKSIKHKLELARWYREFSGYIGQGVNIVRSLAYLESGDYSEPVKQATARLNAAIQAGSTMTDALKNCPELQTPEAIGLIRAGEVGGILQVTSRNLAECIEARNAMTNVELSNWCRTIGAMLSAGVGILATLECAAEVAVNPELKKATQEMIDDIRAGKLIKPALDNHPYLFPPIARVAIVAAQFSGSLDSALFWLADQLALEVVKHLVPKKLTIEDEKSGENLFDVPTVAGFLSDASPAIRGAAADLLARIKAKNSAGDIEKQLRDENPEVRKQAIAALARLQSKEYAGSIVECLSDENVSLRITALKAIADLEFTGAAEAVAEYLTDPDERIADAAVDTLEAVGAIDLLIENGLAFLSSDDWQVRHRGVIILSKHGLPAHTDAFIEALNREQDSFIKLKIALALGMQGRSEAVPVLLDAVDNWFPYWVSEASKALAIIGEPAAIPHIKKAVESGRVHIGWVEEALKKLEELHD